MPVTRYPLDIRVQSSARGRVDLPALRRLIRDVLRDEDAASGTSLALRFADDAFLQRLNREFRDVDAPTDVLSFPAEEGEPFPGQAEAAEAEGRYLGDIAISVERAAAQAATAGLTLEQELSHIVLHGVLHLLGYDHATPEDEQAMEAMEEARLGASIHAAGRHTD